MAGKKKPPKKKSAAKTPKTPKAPRVLLGRPTDDLVRSPHRTGEPDVTKVYAGDTFPGCRNEPVHLVTLELDAIASLPEEVRSLGTLPVVYSNCESCDAWMLDNDEWPESMSFDLEDGVLTPANVDSYRECCTKGSTTRRPKKLRGVELVDRETVPESERSEYPIRVGGEPTWVQHEGYPVCHACDRVMDTFIAQLQAVRLPPEAGCGDQTIYVFACPDCRTTGIVSQCT